MNPKLFNRFQNVYKNPADAIVSIKGTHFVLVNSMTLEGDQCKLCKKAEANLLKISKSLKCAHSRYLNKNETKTCANENNPITEEYSRPILLQVQSLLSFFTM